MNSGALGHGSSLLGCTGSGIVWANEMNLVVNHAPGAGSIARLVNLQSSTQPLCYD